MPSSWNLYQFCVLIGAGLWSPNLPLYGAVELLSPAWEAPSQQDFLALSFVLEAPARGGSLVLGFSLSLTVDLESLLCYYNTKAEKDGLYSGRTWYLSTNLWLCELEPGTALCISVHSLKSHLMCACSSNLYELIIFMILSRLYMNRLCKGKFCDLIN